MDTGNVEVKRATSMSVGLAPDLSLAGLNLLTDDGRQQQFTFPPAGLKALHDQLSQILKNYPALGAPAATPQQQPAPAPSSPALPPTRLRCYSDGHSPPQLVPASPSRAWMDAFPSRHAYRCLPMAIANAYGWELLSPCDFEIGWSGGMETSDITFRCLDDYPWLSHFAESNFARGIATFRAGYLFRTDPGWNLMATGPINNPKPGIVPLSGIVETDWLPYPFTMNWHFTKAGTVRFAKDEPFCLIYPVPQGALEEITPEIIALSDDPALKAEYEAWNVRRKEFLGRLGARDPAAMKEGWQRFYFKGERPDGGEAPSHKNKLRLNPPVDRRK